MQQKKSDGEIDEEGLSIAKFIAQTATDPKIQKSLWLAIFSNLNQEKSKDSKKEDDENKKFQKALAIMEESHVLKIEDVLPHIMDNIKIDQFKAEISKCINVYEESIQKLKKDINEYNKTAEEIKRDIYKVKKRSMEIQYRDRKSTRLNSSHRL